MNLDKSYWENRWVNSETGWDINGPSPAIIDLVLKCCKRSDKILFPGAGSAHDAAHLFHEYGFQNIYICDWAETPLEIFKEQNPTFPKEQVLHTNYFELKQSFDFIVEQTFFCAIDPTLRSQYALKSRELLRPDGVLMGLLFNRIFDRKGPPFGGNKEEYITLFKEKFEIETLEESQKSITPRKGYELIFVFRKC